MHTTHWAHKAKEYSFWQTHKRTLLLHWVPKNSCPLYRLNHAPNHYLLIPINSYTVLTNVSISSTLSTISWTVSNFQILLKLLRVGCLCQTNLSCPNIHTGRRNIELNYWIMPLFVQGSQQGLAKKARLRCAKRGT